MINLFSVEDLFLGKDFKLFIASMKNEQKDYNYYFIKLNEKNLDLDFYIIRNILIFLEEYDINLKSINEENHLYKIIVSSLKEVNENLDLKKEDILNNKKNFSELIISSRVNKYVNYNLLQDEFFKEQEYLLNKYLVKVTNTNLKKNKR